VRRIVHLNEACSAARQSFATSVAARLGMILEATSLQVVPTQPVDATPLV